MKITWRTEWPQWLLIAAQFAVAGLTWNSAPDRFPMHWGLDGQVNRYGGKVEGLLLMPLVSLALYLMLLLLPRLDPGRANYPTFAGPYATIRFSLLVVLTTVYGYIQLSARGQAPSVDSFTPLVVGALCVVLGGVLGKVRPNWFVGIRTPWTLSSKRAWDRTHRAGGWIFIVMGALFMVSTMLRVELPIWAMAGAPLAAGLGLAVYSYFLWRGDPEKVPPAGTLPADNG